MMACNLGGHMVVPRLSLNPQYLRSFYYAAVYRNFTVAADKVYYAGQPTVSNHIKELEKQLGRLFERRARGVELTPRGRVLFGLVAPLLEGLEKLREDFNEQCGELPIARVTVSVSESLGYEFLSGVLKQFKEKRPRVTLTILSRPSPHEMVSRGVADFGVVSMASFWPDLSYGEFLWDPIVLITPAGHPLAEGFDGNLLEEVVRYPFVRLAKQSVMQKMIDDRFLQRGLTLKVALELDRWADVKRAVTLGLGVALAPGVSVSARDADLAVVSTGDEFPKRPYGMVVKRGAYLSPPARELMACIIEACRERPVRELDRVSDAESESSPHHNVSKVAL